VSTVLLLHSSGFSGRQWKRLAAEIDSRGDRALAPDLAGQGAAEPWPEPRQFSFQTDVARLRPLLRDDEPAHVVGHSYGGLLAMHLALAAPAAVRSLVLFDPVAFAVLDDAEKPGLMQRDWSGGSHEEWLRTFVDYWSGDGAWAGLREEARAEFRRVAWVVREGVRSLMEDKTPMEAYASAFRFPVLLMTAEKSPQEARRVIERLSERLPNARIAIVPGAGHLAPVTHPDLVNPIVLEALSAVL
jgi:pimeloyl-ACP methyl ester carboxylesterase